MPLTRKIETGTCSLRSAFRNGSCNNCPLLLIANSVFFCRFNLYWGEEKEIHHQSLHYSRFSFPRAVPGGSARRPLRGSERYSETAWLFFGIGIRRGAKLYAQWSAGERESFPETVLQIAPVGLRHGVERVAVNDDDRRGLS